MRSSTALVVALCALVCSSAFGQALETERPLWGALCARNRSPNPPSPRRAACTESDADEAPQEIGGIVLRIGANVELRYGDQPVKCGAELTVAKVRRPPRAATAPHSPPGAPRASISHTIPLTPPPLATGRSQTASKPGIDIGQADAESKYTLVLVDPDAPGGPFLHYIAADIPGDQRKEHRTVVSYKGARLARPSPAAPALTLPRQAPRRRRAAASTATWRCS